MCEYMTWQNGAATSPRRNRTIMLADAIFRILPPPALRHTCGPPPSSIYLSMNDCDHSLHRRWSSTSGLLCAASIVPTPACQPSMLHLFHQEKGAYPRSYTSSSACSALSCAEQSALQQLRLCCISMRVHAWMWEGQTSYAAPKSPAVTGVNGNAACNRELTQSGMSERI